MKQATNNVSRVIRTYRNPKTGAGRDLRYTASRGMVSRSQVAGADDPEGHAFCFGQDVETCRRIWREVEAGLLADGFEIVGTKAR